MRHKISAAALAAALVFAPFTSAYASAATAHANVRATAQDDEPTDAERDFFTKGQNLFLQGRHEQAASVFRDFLKNYPNSSITDLILLWLGRSYMQLGKLQEAEQVGQRLRGIRDTPFIDIYDSELQAARNDAQQSAPSAPPVTVPTPRPTPVEVARAATPRPTPIEVARAAATPRPTPVRRTPTLSTQPSPTPEVARLPSTVPGAPSQTTARSTRPSRRASRPTVAPTPVQQSASAGNNNLNTPRVRPTPAPSSTTRPPRQSPAAAARANTQIASNNTARAPITAPTPDRTTDFNNRPSSDPALTVNAAPPAANMSASDNSSATQQSGSFSITVKQVPNLQLVLRNAALAASPGQLVQLPLAVTNSGNKEDQFRVETDLPATYQPTFSVAQSGSDTGLPILITPQLARGASYDVLLNIRIPESAPDNQQLRFIVRAASQSDNEIMRVSDASLTVVAAALSATASVSQDTVMPGETFTQTIRVRNEGSAAARGARADFVFNPDFELVSANPSPLVYDRASRTAIWSLGELDPRANRDITVTLKAVPDALAATRTLGRGTMRTQSLYVPSNFDGPSVNVGRVPRARIDAVSKGLTATPGDTIFIPFVVRNPGNYAESYNLQIIAPGAPGATVFADTNGDGRHQDSEVAVTQTAQLDPRGGQFPLLLRVEIPRNTPDGQQFAYNLVVRSSTQNRVASEDSTVLKVATPRVRIRSEQVSTEVAPGETFFYRLVLVNDSGGLAKNLVVTEVLPDALEFVSSEPSLNAQDAPGGSQRFVWRLAELSPGDTSVLLVTVRLKAGLQAETTLTPRHTLGYQDTNGNSYMGQ